MDQGKFERRIRVILTPLIYVPQVVELDDIEVVVLHQESSKSLTVFHHLADAIRVWVVLGRDLRRYFVV